MPAQSFLVYRLISMAAAKRNSAMVIYKNMPSKYMPSHISRLNLWVLVLGLYFTRLGSVRNHLGILNLGLFIIGFLAVLRFFDEDIPFVWRGVFFLATGIAFFVANYIVIKRRKSLVIMKDHQI